MMMMMMHHHHPQVDGHSAGLIVVRSHRQAHQSTEEVEGFPWSPHLPLSVEYSAHTAPAAAMVAFCDAKNEGGKFACISLCARSAVAPLQLKLCRHYKDLCCRARAELSNVPLDAIWVQF